MTSALAEMRGLQGAQRPRVSSVPDYVSSAGVEAVELARMAGLHLDPWQEHVLEHSLGERPNGKWAAFEVGLVVSRQNGKGAILEARELAGLFLLGEKLITHSAHQFDTSLEAFRRLLMLIENTPDLDRRVKRVSRSHGEEGIELKSGQRVRFRTRTKGGGRGFSGDCLILDEAMILPESAHGALFPTLSARPNPQVWYTGSAVDQEIHEHGIVFSRVRERGHTGDDPRLAFFEWSLPHESPADLDDDATADPEGWANSNPGFGIRISPEFVENERRAMAFRTFAVERLGVGDWPDTSEAGSQVISPQVWRALADPDSEVNGKVAFAFDVSPGREWASIAIAGQREDGLRHVEIIDRQPGTGWLPDRLAELAGKWPHMAVIADTKGPAGSLVPKLEKRGVKVEAVTVNDLAQACGTFYDECEQSTVRHLATPEMAAALKGAQKRTLGDAWAWSRKSSAVDISPLVAATLALWKFTAAKPKPRATFEVLA